MNESTATPLEFLPPDPTRVTAPSTTAAAESPSPLESPRNRVAPADYQLVIRAGQTERLYWRDVWKYRDLLFLLAYRDISVHYKQAVMGVAWAVLRPLLTMAAFVFVFRNIAGFEGPANVAYPLLVLAGMLPWQMFATALGQSSNSLVENANLVSKVYFPRIIVPLSSIAVSVIDFLICLPVLIAMMAWYGVAPTWRIVMLPAFIIMAMASAAAFGVWLCALNVRYRDIRYVIPFLIQFGIYVSPVGYASTKVPEEWRPLYMLNPLAGVIDGVRWSLFGDAVVSPLTVPSFYASLAIVAAVLTGGIWYFRNTERTIADVI